MLSIPVLCSHRIKIRICYLRVFRLSSPESSTFPKIESLPEENVSLEASHWHLPEIIFHASLQKVRGFSYGLTGLLREKMTTTTLKKYSYANG